MKKLLIGLYMYIGLLLAGMMIMPIMVFALNDEPEKVFSQLHQFRCALISAITGIWIIALIFIYPLLQDKPCTK